MEDSYFNILPIEIIAMIWKFLPPYYGYIIKLVCKDWYMICENVMNENESIRDNIGDNIKELLVYSGNNTSDLNILKYYLVEYNRYKLNYTDFLSICIDYELYKEFKVVYNMTYTTINKSSINNSLCIPENTYLNFFEYIGKGKTINSIKLMIFLLISFPFINQDIYTILLRQRRMIQDGEIKIGEKYTKKLDSIILNHIPNYIGLN